MKKTDYELALEVAKRAEYDGIEELMPLKDGTSVFRPIIDGMDDDEDGCTGLPMVIFVQQGQAFFSSPDEAIDYNYLLYKKNGSEEHG